METNQEIPNIEEKKCDFSCCSCSGWKVIVCVIVGLLILAGAVYAGYFLGRKSLSPRELLIPPKPTTTQIPIDDGPVLIEVSPTPEEKSDWKTYKNTKYGYQFKYPNNWELNRGPGDLNDEELGKGRAIDIYGPLSHPRDPGTGFTVDTNELHQTGETKECRTLDDCISKVTSYFPSNVTKSDEKFLGNTAKRIIFDRSTALYVQTFSHLFVIIKDDLYHFTMSSEAKSFQNNKLIFDQILSTFKFLD